MDEAPGSSGDLCRLESAMLEADSDVLDVLRRYYQDRHPSTEEQTPEPPATHHSGALWSLAIHQISERNRHNTKSSQVAITGHSW